MNFDDGILYDYNIEAYKKLMKAIEKDGKACAIHSTGTGKMYLALKWLIDNKDSSFAYVAPTNVILDKFLDIIINECFPDKKEELYECKTIEKRVAKVEKLLGNKVHLLTYAGVNEKAKKGKVKLKVDKIVLDEFHHLGADQWGSAVETFLKFNDEAEVLGLSATPIRSDKKNMVDELFNGITASEITLKDSLEKEILPVPTFIGAIYSFEEEINKLENKFKVKRYSKETQEKIEKYIKEARKILEEAGGLKEVFDFSLTQVKDSKNAKFIVFCSDMDDKDNKMVEAKNWFNSSVNIRSVDYSLGKKENLKVIKEFEEDNSVGIKLLFSIDMLNEGLHVKDLDGVIMMRPTASDIIFHQQLGRALASGSKKGTKPVVLDLVNNIDVLDNDIGNTKDLIAQYGGSVYGSKQNQIPDFKVQSKMIDIVNYLRGITYTFEERIAPLVDYFNKKGSIGKINVKEIYNYNGENFQIGELIIRLRNQYRLSELSQEEYQAYKQKYKGKIMRPLTKQQIKKLESLGMYWNPSAFEERIAPLVAYCEEFGSIESIVQSDVYEFKGEKRNIGTLVDELRKQYRLRNVSKEERKKMKSRALTDEEIEVLEKMGMKWVVTVTFNERIAPLIDYYNKEGSISKISEDVYNYEGKFYNIGNLIDRLRKQYKLRTAVGDERKKERLRPLTDEEVEMLEKMGMIWDARVTFEKRIAPLVAYCNEGKSIKDITKNTPRYEYEGEKVDIAGLVSRLRRQYKISQLTEEEYQEYKEKIKSENQSAVAQLTKEQIEILEKMGMNWEVNAFEKIIEPLVDYYNKNGSIGNITAKYTYDFNGENVNIGGIVSRLRKRYKITNLSEQEYEEYKQINKHQTVSRLTKEQITILESMGMIWNPSQDKKLKK